MSGNNSLVLDCDLNEHLIKFKIIIQFISEEEIEAKQNIEGDFRVDENFWVKDLLLKDKCRTLEWKMAVIYLIYISYTDTVLQTGIVNTEVDKDTTLIGKFWEDYEITGDIDDIVFVEDIKEKSYGTD